MKKLLFFSKFPTHSVSYLLSFILSASAFLFKNALNLSSLSSVFVFSSFLFLCLKNSVGIYKKFVIYIEKRFNSRNFLFFLLGSLQIIVFVSLNLFLHWEKLQQLPVNYLRFLQYVLLCFDKFNWQKNPLNLRNYLVVRWFLKYCIP